MKSFKILLCAVLIPVLLCGCMNTQTLQSLSIVEGMGVDKKQTGLDVTVQTLNLTKEGTGSEALSGNITMNATESGDTISKAITQLSKSLSKKLFFGQNKLIVFGKDVAQAGIASNLDYFVRSTDSRPDVVMCISDSKAKDVLESKENDALVPCENILDLLKNGEKTGFGAYMTVGEVLNLYADETSDIYLPVVHCEKEHVRVKGIGLFSDNKLVYVMDDEETFGLLMLQDKIEGSLLDLQDEALGKIGVEIIDFKTRLRARQENGRPVLSADIKCELILDEIEKGLVSRISDKDIRKIEKLAQEEIYRLCQKGFAACRANASDPLKMGEYLRKEDRAYYSSVRESWHDVLRTAQLETQAKCKISKVNDNAIRA